MWKNQFITIEQHDDGDEPGRRLQMQRRDAVGQALDDADGDEPGDQRGGERRAGAGHDGPLIALARADHVGGHGGEHEDALESFAEHEDSDVEDTRAEVAVRKRIGEAAGAEDLQQQDGRHRADSGSDEHRYQARLHVVKTCRNKDL